MIDINKRMESVNYAIKDNNDWFYDKPTEKDMLERTTKMAGMYITLAPKWIALNNAALQMQIIITELKEKFFEQEREIARLKRILEDNDINATKEEVR